MPGAPMLPIGSPYAKELDKARRKFLAIPETGEGEQRYAFYRRKGLSPTESRLGAISFERNMAEQRERRLGHDTGAAGQV